MTGDYLTNLAQSAISLADKHKTQWGEYPVRFVCAPIEVNSYIEPTAWSDTDILLGGIRVMVSSLCPLNTIYCVSENDLEHWRNSLKDQFVEMQRDILDKMALARNPHLMSTSGDGHALATT